MFTIAREHALRSLFAPQVAETQPRIMLFTAYVPMAKTHIAKYGAPVFSVAQASTKPSTAIDLAMAICHVRSLYLSMHRVSNDFGLSGIVSRCIVPDQS